jgi:hypothetical protein
MRRHQERSWKEERRAQVVGLLFLVRVACGEDKVTDPLELACLVAEEDMAKLVHGIALLAPGERWHGSQARCSPAMIRAMSFLAAVRLGSPSDGNARTLGRTPAVWSE